jgi:hypothetical protein
MYVPLLPQNSAVINIQLLFSRVKLGMWTERLYIVLRFKCLYCSEIRIRFNENRPSVASGIKVKRDKIKFTQQPKC